MKTLLTFSIFLSSISAFAGTARTLNIAEQLVVARAMAEVIPSMIGGKEAQLEGCIIGNMAAQGQKPAFIVECEYTATATGFKAFAIFDSLQMDGEELTGASFKSLAK